MLIRQFGLSIAAIVAFSTAAFGQSLDGPFQVRYFGYLSAGDSIINLSNSGGSSTVALPTQNGVICANLYAISPDTHALVGCCSCVVPANALRSVNVTADILGGVANIPPSNSVVVKALGSTATGGACNAATVGTGGNVLTTGMLVWGTSIRPLPKDTVTTVTGTPPSTQTSGPTPISSSTKYGSSVIQFSPSTLSAAELVAITTQCGQKPVTACGSCKLGAQ
jgi:hypothetical protein